MASSGTVLCVCAALLYGTSLPLSRLLFDGATNPLTLGLVRYLALAIGLGVWVQWVRRFEPRLGVLDTLVAFVVGLLFFVVSVGQLLAISRIPVSLTTLLFYSYPAMTILAVALRRRQAPGRRDLAVVVMASAGLVLALDADFARLDPLGMAFALLAAASAGASFLIIEGALAHADALRASAASAFSASVAAALAVFLFSEFRLPASATDVGLLALVMCAFAAAMISMFLGVTRAGSVRASLVLFLEPITAIVVAILLLGETLTLRQSAGAVAVVVAVLISAVRRGRPRLQASARR